MPFHPFGSLQREVAGVCNSRAILATLTCDFDIVRASLKSAVELERTYCAVCPTSGGYQRSRVGSFCGETRVCRGEDTDVFFGVMKDAHVNAPKGIRRNEKKVAWHHIGKAAVSLQHRHPQHEPAILDKVIAPTDRTSIASIVLAACEDRHGARGLNWCSTILSGEV